MPPKTENPPGPMSWASVDPRRNHTVDYDPELSAKIEEAYQKNPKGSYNLELYGSKYTISFTFMRQTNRTGGARKVVRRPAPAAGAAGSSAAAGAGPPSKAPPGVHAPELTQSEKLAQYALKKGCFADPKNPSGIKDGSDVVLSDKAPAKCCTTLPPRKKPKSPDDPLGATNWEVVERGAGDGDGDDFPVIVEGKTQELPVIGRLCEFLEDYYSSPVGIFTDSSCKQFLWPSAHPTSGAPASRLDVPIKTKTEHDTSWDPETRQIDLEKIQGRFPDGKPEQKKDLKSDDEDKDKDVRDLEPDKRRVGGIRDNAFLIQNLLTPNECANLANHAQPMLESTEKTFAQSYRKADRVLLKAPKVAQELYRRILPHIDAEKDYKNRIPLCFGQGGVWVPFGLNDCIKINRYKTGGMFAQHRDGPWIPREDQASIYTVVVYLNEDFAGGLTVMSQSHANTEECQVANGEDDQDDEDDAEENESREPARASRFYTQGQRSYDAHTVIFPCTGSALIFNHDCVHGSSPVASGAKWILRTELIMQKVHSFYVDRFAYTTEEKYLQTVKLYEESQKSLMDGKREEFVVKYQEVLQMQREAMNGAVDGSERSTPFIEGTNLDVLGSIFSYLSDTELLGLMTLSKSGFYQVVQSDVWEIKLTTSFPSAVRHLGAAKSASEATAVNDAHSCVHEGQLQHLGSLPIDWFTLYRQRKLGAKRFLPVGLVLRHHGAAVISHPGAHEQFWDPDVELSGASLDATVRCDEGEEKWKIANLDQLYSDWSGGFPWHMNQPNDRTQEVRRATLEPIDDLSDTEEDNLKLIVNSSGAGTVAVSILATQVLRHYDPVWYPTLVVGLHNWYRFGMKPEAAKNQFLQDYMNLTRTPAMQIVHPVMPALAALNIIEGVQFTGDIGTGTHFIVAFACLTKDSDLKTKDLTLNVTIVDRSTGSIITGGTKAEVFTLPAKKTPAKAESPEARKKRQVSMFCKNPKDPREILPVVFYYDYLAAAVGAVEADTRVSTARVYATQDLIDEAMEEEGSASAWYSKDEEGRYYEDETKTDDSNGDMFNLKPFEDALLGVEDKDIVERYKNIKGMPTAASSVIEPEVRKAVYRVISTHDYNKGVASLCGSANFREECTWRPFGAFSDL